MDVVNMTEPAGIELIRLADAFLAMRMAKRLTDQTLDAAIGGEQPLYVAVPEGMSVYAGRPWKTVNEEQIHRPMTVLDRFFSAYNPLGGTPFSALPKPRHEVRFLALSSQHAKELKLSGRVKLREFASGLENLKIHSGAPETAVSIQAIRASTMNEPPIDIDHGTFVEANLVPPLRLRPIETGDSMDGSLDDSEVEFQLDEIYMDKIFALALCEHYNLPVPGKSLARYRSRVVDVSDSTINLFPEEDPYQLKESAPGVFTLYMVASMCFSESANKEESEKSKKLKADKLLEEHGHSKLYKSEVRKQAVKLLGHKHVRGRGLRKKRIRTFNEEYIDHPAVRKYLRDDFVSTSLALILHATEEWLNSPWSKPSETRPSASNSCNVLVGDKAQSILISQLIRMGFDAGDELNAVAKIITWSEAT